MLFFLRILLLALSLLLLVSPASGLIVSTSNPNLKDNDILAAVLIPGFLTGGAEFQPLCDALTERGIPTIAVPMPNWHWIPCLGGRSARPILERIDWTVKHVIANHGDVSKVPVQNWKDYYTLQDCWADFQTNPGGLYLVGGSDQVDEYPTDVHPRGSFQDSIAKITAELHSSGSKSHGRILLIGHSAGGWLGRAYLSDRPYGGKAYKGRQYVHSLVTLGTPHATAPGPAFSGIAWCNKELILPVDRGLAVGGTGFRGNEWGSLTRGAYQFCCPHQSTGELYDGDGLTPIFSSVGFPGADQLILDGVTHFCWSDVFGGSWLAPELSRDYKEGRPWYGSDAALDEWVDWIKRN